MLRRLALVILISSLVALLFIVCGLLWLRTDKGSTWLIATLEKVVLQPKGVELNEGACKLDWWTGLSCRGLRIQSDTVNLSGAVVNLSYRVQRLFPIGIVIGVSAEDLQAQTRSRSLATVDEVPRPAETKDPSGPGDLAFQWPSWLEIEIDSVLLKQGTWEHLSSTQPKSAQYQIKGDLELKARLAAREMSLQAKARLPELKMADVARATQINCDLSISLIEGRWAKGEGFLEGEGLEADHQGLQFRGRRFDLRFKKESESLLSLSSEIKGRLAAPSGRFQGHANLTAEAQVTTELSVQSARAELRIEPGLRVKLQDISWASPRLRLEGEIEANSRLSRLHPALASLATSSPVRIKTTAQGVTDGSAWVVEETTSLFVGQKPKGSYQVESKAKWRLGLTSLETNGEFDLSLPSGNRLAISPRLKVEIQGGALLSDGSASVSQDFFKPVERIQAAWTVQWLNWKDTERSVMKVKSSVAAEDGATEMRLQGEVMRPTLPNRAVGSLQVELTSDLRRQNREHLTGQIQAPLSLEISPGLEVNLAGIVELRGVAFRRPDIEVEGLNGRLRLSQRLRLSPLDHKGLLDINSFERADFDRLQPVIRSGERINISRLRLRESRWGPLVALVTVQQNLIALRQLEVDGPDGQLSGEAVVDLHPERLKAAVMARVTNLDLSRMLRSEALGRLPPGDRLISGRVGSVVDLSSSRVDGRFDIYRLGRASLSSILGLIDPEFRNLSLNRVRQALPLVEPRRLGVVIQRNRADLEVEAETAGVRSSLDVRSVDLTAKIGEPLKRLRQSMKLGGKE